MKTTNKGGRPAHKPDQRNQQTVEALAGFGIPADKIATVLGINKVTLWKYYRDELDRGAAQVEAKLIGNLLRMASGNDGTALKAVIFALRCRFGWSEYAPMRPEQLGKKEQATLIAETAHVGSEWSDLLQ